jgi:hypothetical protein
MTYGEETRRIGESARHRQQHISTEKYAKDLCAKRRTKSPGCLRVRPLSEGSVNTTNRVFSSIGSLRPTMVAGHQPNPDLAMTTNTTGDSAYLAGVGQLLEVPTRQ